MNEYADHLNEAVVNEPNVMFCISYPGGANEQEWVGKSFSKFSLQTSVMLSAIKTSQGIHVRDDNPGLAEQMRGGESVEIIEVPNWVLTAAISLL